MTGAMRAAVGTVVTIAGAVGYVHGIAWLQDWSDARFEDRAQQVVEQVIEPAQKVAPPEPVLMDDPASVDVSVVIEPLPEEDPPATEDPGWDLTCGEHEWANEDLTGCVPLPGWDDGVCQEDEPCWDCETMGNLTCGPAYIEPPTEVGADWEGLLVGDVIVCPPGLEVSIDVTPAGTTWAACM